MSRSPELHPNPTPPTPEATGELPVAEVQAHLPALHGLRRFITAYRLAWAEETLADKEQNHRVLGAVAEGAQYVRSFRSPAESPDESPMTWRQRFVSNVRQRQAEKGHRLVKERWRVNQIYGEPIYTPTHTPSDLSRMTTREQGWAGMKMKVGKQDAERGHSLGTEKNRVRLFGGEDEHGNTVRRTRMRRSQRRAELTAAAYDKKNRNKLHRGGEEDEGRKFYQRRGVEARLHRASHGETLAGRRRKSSIERTRRKRDRLSKQLTSLRREAAAVQPPSPPEPELEQPKGPVVHTYRKGGLFGASGKPTFYQKGAETPLGRTPVKEKPKHKDEDNWQTLGELEEIARMQKNFKPKDMIWRNKDSDVPVRVIAYSGARDGRRYFRIAGSRASVPEDELFEPTSE